MAQDDREQQYARILDHLHSGTPSTNPSDLRLPTLDDPCFKQHLLGYQGAYWDPSQLGAACIVSPRTDGSRGPYGAGDFSLNPVSSPLFDPGPDPPSLLPSAPPVYPPELS